MSAGSLPVGRPRLDARALLWVGGLAAALVAARAALRGIHVPGHAALPALFLMVTAAARVRVPGAALAVALPAAAGAALGVLAGPGGVASLLLAALVVDAASWLRPRFVASAAACAGVGALAGALRLVPDLPLLLGGLPDLGAPAWLSIAAHAGFGALGAALVPLASRTRR
jgi:hypothetical protein